MSLSESESFRAKIQDRNQFVTTCDGGDLGVPESPSIWLFGIEPGWSLSDEVAEAKGLGVSEGILKDYSVELQLAWPFNRNAFKLLAAIEEIPISEYRKFAKEKRPFERDSKGYFKGNLYPAALNKLTTWHEDATYLTGFNNKEDYQNWVKERRFPIVESGIDVSRPKLFIGTGLGHLEDFMKVTKTKDFKTHSFSVKGQSKRLIWSTDGIVPIVVLPHLSGGKNGLNSHESIRIAAEFIRNNFPSLKRGKDSVPC